MDTRYAAIGAPFDCTLRLPIPIQGKIRCITLKSAEIPLCFYPVRAPYNTFRFTVSSITYTATVTPGNYTLTQLLTALGAACVATGGLASCTFTENTTLNKVAVTAGSSITIVGSSGFDLAEMLGFTGGQTGTTFTATNSYNINHDMYFNLNLDNLPSSNLSNPPQSFKLPITEDNGSLYFYLEQQFVTQTIHVNGNVSELSHIKLRVTDRYGATVDNNGRNWSFLLEVETD